jgi:flagella basal body P-ring formation protein FlgA
MMIRLVATALLIAFAGTATAQVTGSIGGAPSKPPKLKELVVVTGDLVRIGDLVENAGASAGVAVFRSPDLGYTGGVPVARVKDALAPYKLASLDTGNISEVVVTRLSRAITAKEIEARITRALANQYGFGDAKNLSLTFDRELRTIHIEPGAAADLQIARINVDQRTGRFAVILEVPGSAAARHLSLRYSGQAVETLDATILVRPLNRGEVIKASDVVTERRPKGDQSGDYISAASAVGLAAKRSLRSGATLNASDLMKPEAVQRNEVVTIIYEIPGVVLTARGKALEAGAVGDIVGVVNIQSNRTVQATIVAPGRVTVTAIAPVAPGPARTEPSTIE